MKTTNYWTAAEIRPQYDALAEMYATAFAGEPWYEVSKCPDVSLRCVSGLSALAVGTACDVCQLRPSDPAYRPDELIGRWNDLSESRDTLWYTEENSQGLTLAALAWKASADRIAAEKYSDVPEMSQWLGTQFGEEPVVWLDEVFSDRENEPRGNLRNFGTFCTELCRKLDKGVLAYRTITPQMIRAAQRDFGSRATIFEPGTEVPDRRTFIKIEGVS